MQYISILYDDMHAFRWSCVRLSHMGGWEIVMILITSQKVCEGVQSYIR